MQANYSGSQKTDPGRSKRRLSQRVRIFTGCHESAAPGREGQRGGERQAGGIPKKKQGLKNRKAIVISHWPTRSELAGVMVTFAACQ